MLYIAYLDEFGHIGPYISHDHPRHKTHPIFGLGGFVLPYTAVRYFATFFFKLKNDLLDFEIKKSGKHPAQWEKKGAALYTSRNMRNYKQELLRASFRYLNKIREIDGFTFYVGMEKRRDEDQNPKGIYYSVLKEAIKRLDEECVQKNSQLLIILDQQGSSDKQGDKSMRTGIVQNAAQEMFGAEPRRTLIEPPHSG